MTEEMKAKSSIFVHVELNEKGEIQTSMSGDTLVLLGLCEVLRDNVKARMGLKPTNIKPTTNDEAAGD